jgi:hypothetical protein
MPAYRLSGYIPKPFAIERISCAEDIDLGLFSSLPIGQASFPPDVKGQGLAIGGLTTHSTGVRIDRLS